MEAKLDLTGKEDGNQQKAPLISNSTLKRRTEVLPRWPKALFLATLIVVLAAVPIVLLVVTNHNYLLKDTVELLFDSTLPCDVQAPWTSWSGLFTINGRTPVVSFATAKGIDIVWDLVVGQGGRVLLAWMAWRVFGEAVILIMEEEAVPCELFTYVAMTDVFNTAKGIYQTLRRNRSTRVRLILAWILLSICYLSIFPTLISAATSYVGVSDRAILLYDDSTTSIASFTNETASVVYDFHNGTDAWLVNFKYWEVGNAPCDLTALIDHPFSAGPGWTDFIQVNGTVYNVTGANTTCGFDYQGHFYNANVNPDHETGLLSLGYINSSQIICQPAKGYQWGFSYQILLLVVIVHTLWSATLYFVWLGIHHRSPLVQEGQRLGPWKAMLELGGPLREELGASSTSCSESELAGMIRKLPRVKYMNKGEGRHELVLEGDAMSMRAV